jgi:hypothetical protein
VKVFTNRQRPDKITARLTRSLSRARRHYNKTKCIGSILALYRASSKLTSWRQQREVQSEASYLRQQPNPKLLSRLVRSRNPPALDNITSLKLPDGTICSSPEELCKVANSFFSSCYTPPHPSPLQNHASIMNVNSVSLENIPLTMSNIRAQLCALKVSSTPGPDGMPSIPLSQGGPDIPLLLYHLFSASLKQGVVPSQWKISVVYPHFKSGSRTSIDSYRGIHHTSLLSRILERIIKSELTKYFHANHHISDRQYGFLSRRSTACCQVDFLNSVSAGYEANLGLIMVYLDIKKAFDSVPHMPLLRMLEKVGISGPLLRWFHSYFHNRTQVTRISGCSSPPTPITSGVVQGSVLGPILFLLYINSALSQIRNGEPFLFADDIKIVYKIRSNNFQHDLSAVQTDLDALTRWSTDSGLEFSVDKSFLLTSRCPLPPSSLLLCGYPLRVAHETRDLGVRYTHCFNFSYQAEYQVAKARQLCYYILRYFHLSPTKLALYKQRIRPILEYCPMVFQHYSQQSRHAIERIQRMFTRKLLPESSTLNYRQRCELFSLDPLWMRRLKLNLTFLHGLIHSRVHTVNSKLELLSSKYHMRCSSFKLKCENSRTSFRYNFYILFYSRLWNKLPEHIRSLDNPMVFRKSLNCFLSMPVIHQMFTPYLSTDSLFECGPPSV